MVAIGIKVEGLDEFRHSVASVNADLPEAIKTVLEASADMVADGARPLFPVMSGRARDSIEGDTRGGTVGVAMGEPYAPWLDFGGAVGRNDSVRRPYRKEGRYVVPTAKRMETSGEFERAADDSLADIMHRAGIEAT